MESVGKTWFRYLPASPTARRWGLYVVDTGYSSIPPGVDYPPAQHPDEHMLSWEQGRTLDSLTLVYITRGTGRFESTTAGQRRILAGDMFLLHPGVWHRYRPNPKTGWDEYWVELKGPQITSILAYPALSPRHPVIHLGHHERILQLFMEIPETIKTAHGPYEPLIASLASQIIARILPAIQQSEGEDWKTMQLARFRMLEHIDQAVDFHSLATELGMSLSGFRKKFRRLTGMPPGKYLQQARHNRAATLLAETDIPIGEIAQRLGFDNVYYFSNTFKKLAGIPPTTYRKKSRKNNLHPSPSAKRQR